MNKKRKPVDDFKFFRLDILDSLKTFTNIFTEENIDKFIEVFVKKWYGYDEPYKDKEFYEECRIYLYKKVKQKPKQLKRNQNENNLSV